MYRVHICNFSTALCDLKGAAARDPIVVFDTILAQGGRFSTFDVNAVLAKPVSMLFGRGYLEDDKTQGYPWTRCTATVKGTAWREGRLCVACGGEGQTTRMVSKRTGIMENCAACNRTGITP